LTIEVKKRPEIKEPLTKNLKKRPVFNNNSVTNFLTLIPLYFIDKKRMFFAAF
jgi:hypothetical protein